MKIFSINKLKSEAGKRVTLWLIFTLLISVLSYLVFPFIIKNLLSRFGEKYVLTTILSFGVVINFVTSTFLLIRAKHYMRISLWVLLIAPSLLLGFANLLELYDVLIVNDLFSAYPISEISEFVVSFSLMVGVILTAPIFTSLTKSNEQLRSSELKYRSIFETSSDAVVLIDNKTFIILDCNHAMIEYFGYSQKELIGKHALELSAEQSNTEHSFRNNINAISLRYFKRKDGTIFPAEISGSIFMYDDKEVRVGYIRDLSEKLKKEEQLQHSEERFRIAMDALNGYLYEIDLETNKAYRSQNFEQILGYTVEEIPNDLTADNKFIHPDDREMVVNNRNIDLLSGQSQFDREYRVRKKDGTYIVVNDRGNIISDAYGKAVKLFGSMVDITERREAEKRIQENEIYLHGILESTDDGILAVDNNGTVIKANKRFAELWNIPEELLKSAVDKELLQHMQDQLVNPQEFLSGIQISNNSDRSDFDIIRFNDKRVFERYSTALKLNEDIVGRVWSFRDVTEKNNAENNLRDSEHLLKEDQKISKIGSYILDIKNGVWSGSDVLNSIFGIENSDDHSVEGWVSVVHSDQQKEMADYFLHEVIGKKNRFDKEYKIQKKNTGEVRWVNGIGELEFDTTGAPIRMMGTIQDITERKLAQQVIINSENKFRLVWENSLDAMRLADENGTITLVNKAYCDLVGKNNEELVGCSIGSVYLSDERETLQKYCENFRNRTVNPRFEGEMWLWNGVSIFVEAVHTFLTIPEQPTMLLSVFHDITTRKHAQQELNRERTLLRTVIDNIPDPIYVKDLQGRKILANIADAHYAGKQTVEEVLGKTDAELYPEDIAAHSSYEEEMILRTGNSLNNYEGTFLSSTGERRWLIGNKLLLKDTDGVNAGFLGINHDITERKLAEEKNRMLAHTIESISEAVTVTDLEDRLIYVNKAFSEVFGYSKEEVIGKHIGLLWSNNNHKDIGNELLQHTNMGGWKGELLNISKNGNEFPIHLSTSQVKNELGEIVALVGVAEDITEQKQSQKLILARLRISEFAKDNTLHALMQKTLDEAELLTGSCIGFFHFVEPDQENLSLQIWSTNTLATMCTAKGQGSHYPISKAGVWVDCIATRKPVVHNDYDSLPYRKGMPEGHATVIRELVVPIIRNNKVTGILGVGNKKTLFNENDTKIVEQLANLAWDIVLRKQAEDAFTESERRWRYALEGAGDAVWEWDFVTNKVFRSKRWKEMLGYLESEVSDSSNEAERLVHPEDIALFKNALRSCMDGKTESFAIEYRLLCKNGEYKWILKRGKTMHLQTNGKPSRIIGTHTDISIFKKIQLEINDLNEHLEEKIVDRTRQLQEMNKQLETFSYSVSHDLRAPLRAIDTFSRILFEEEVVHLSDNGKRQIALIRENTARMNRLIDDLLEFSRSNRSEIKKMPFDMNILVRKILTDVTSTNPERKIEAQIHSMPKVFGDPSLFRQVFINLIGNAVKFSKHRDISIIEIGGSESTMETTFYIKDNGAGFDMRYLDKLFGIFQRLHTESEFEGTGVGLAIVHRIIQRHGGTIQAVGEIDNGATFTFTIPKQLDT